MTLWCSSETIRAARKSAQNTPSISTSTKNQSSIFKTNRKWSHWSSMMLQHMPSLKPTLFHKMGLPKWWSRAEPTVPGPLRSRNSRHTNTSEHYTGHFRQQRLPNVERLRCAHPPRWCATAALCRWSLQSGSHWWPSKCLTKLAESYELQKRIQRKQRATKPLDSIGFNGNMETKYKTKCNLAPGHGPCFQHPHSRRSLRSSASSDSPGPPPCRKTADRWKGIGSVATVYLTHVTHTVESHRC